jgi:hypothetical protein
MATLHKPRCRRFASAIGLGQPTPAEGKILKPCYRPRPCRPLTPPPEWLLARGPQAQRRGVGIAREHRSRPGIRSCSARWWSETVGLRPTSGVTAAGCPSRNGVGPPSSRSFTVSSWLRPEPSAGSLLPLKVGLELPKCICNPRFDFLDRLNDRRSIFERYLSKDMHLHIHCSACEWMYC